MLRKRTSSRHCRGQTRAQWLAGARCADCTADVPLVVLRTLSLVLWSSDMRAVPGEGIVTAYQSFGIAVLRDIKRCHVLRDVMCCVAHDILMRLEPVTGPVCSIWIWLAPQASSRQRS